MRRQPDGGRHVVVADRVRVLDLRRRGEDEDAARVTCQRIGEEQLVDVAAGAGDGRERLGRREVQAGGDVAALEVEVEQATSRL